MQTLVNKEYSFHIQRCSLGGDIVSISRFQSMYMNMRVINPSLYNISTYVVKHEYYERYFTLKIFTFLRKLLLEK